MFVYIRKLFTADVDSQISFKKEVAVHFFNASENFLQRKENLTIHIFHFNNRTNFTDIEIQPATDYRFSLSLNSFLATNGDKIQPGDLLYLEKVDRSYGVKLIKDGNDNYKIFNALLNEKDRHFCFVLTKNFKHLKLIMNLGKH
jgi:hypothetical protein